MTRNKLGMELHKCPFCGGNAAMKEAGMKRFGPCTYWAQCGNCKAETAPYSTETEAAKHWNRRAGQ